MKTYFELEAGSVAFKIEDGEMKFLTIYRHNMNDYTFPKGHVEESESLEDTAQRETHEETGYPVEVADFVHSFEYKVKEKKDDTDVHIIRRVYFYESKVLGESNNKDNPDEKEGKIVPTWLSFEEALKKFSYDSDKEIINKIYLKYKENVKN